MYLNKALQIYLQICCRHSPIYDMNVRIFWVCVMECTCVQTRPWFILSSEIVILGMESEPLLTPREKSPPSEAQSGDYNPSTDPINCLARHEQTAIFRLRTGHCGLRAHLKRIGIMDSALCDCKEAKQTVHHILQDCPIWRKQRHQLWP